MVDAAGGILVGKVVSEIGRDALGPVGCRNPWNPPWSPGTSSSGSGAAVAASLGLASIGTDTGGSVRHPASNSGVVGMKATFGRISRFGVWASSWSTDQAGPLTKTVEDNALLLEILGAYDPQDPVSLNEPRYTYRANLRAGIKGLRIGVPADDWMWTDWLSEEEEQVVRKAIQVLETLGASLVEVHLPRAAEARAILSELVSETPVYLDDHFTSEQIEAWPEHHGSRERGRAQPFADYLWGVFGAEEVHFFGSISDTLRIFLDSAYVQLCAAAHYRAIATQIPYMILFLFLVLGTAREYQRLDLLCPLRNNTATLLQCEALAVEEPPQDLLHGLDALDLLLEITELTGSEEAPSRRRGGGLRKTVYEAADLSDREPRVPSQSDDSQRLKN